MTKVTPRYLLAVLISVVVVAVGLTHWRVLTAQAISLDDDLYLTDNPLVQNPGWGSAGRILSEVFEPSKVTGYYQPLSIITVMFDYAMGGRIDNTLPFHRTSLVLHVANTVLVILFAYMLLGCIPQASGSLGRAYAAAMVGLLFGLHPLTVEPIAWIGERKTPLSALFTLWCLILYVRYVSTRSWTTYGLCLAAYLLALLSKPTSTPLPVLMLLLDYWPLQRIGRRALLEKLPFVGVGVLSAVVTVVSCAKTSGIGIHSEQSAMQLPLLICHNLAFYVFKMVWPANLSMMYPPVDPVSIANPAIWGGILVSVVLIAVMLFALRWTRALLVCGLFFFVAIFPTLGVVGYSWVSVSDKYVYIPAIGLLIVLAWFLCRLWGASPDSSRLFVRRGILLAVVGVLACAEVAATRSYLAHWQSSESLYRHMLTISPRLPLLYNGLGSALAAQGRSEEAIGQYREALRLYPDYPEAHNNLAAELIALGQYDDAAGHATAVIRLRPGNAKGHYNLGVARLRRQDMAAAVNHFSDALRIQPDFAMAHNNLGVAFSAQGNAAEAIRHLSEAVRLQPDNMEARFNYASLLEHAGRLDEAIEHYRRALCLNPQDADVRGQLNRALEKQNAGRKS